MLGRFWSSKKLIGRIGICRNFDFIPGEEGDEVMFIDPEELLLQESEVDVPARAYGAHMKWQELYSEIVQ